MIDSIVYLVLVNILGFLIMGFDKWAAKANLRRISEKTFFLLALFGGALGILSAMYIFRHKTRHSSFVYGIPLLLIANLILLVAICSFKK